MVLDQTNLRLMRRYSFVRLFHESLTPLLKNFL
jgi:hypothetical protein